jgi:hypothetical protein
MRNAARPGGVSVCAGGTPLGRAFARPPPVVHQGEAIMKRKDGSKAGRGAARSRPGGDYADPYQRVRRPRPAAGADAPSFARRPRAPAGREVSTTDSERRPPRREPGGGFVGRERGRGEGRSFTVTLDPDVARVFRGDASVNKALRLVMQLMQVVQGPRDTASRSARTGVEPRRGYQGSAEARGFSRKARFADDDEQ